MKTDIHPAVHPAIFVDTSCGEEFITTSTMTSEETRDIDGVTYQVHRIEISSASHPFYTGKEILIDTSRRVEKFQEKMKKQEAAAANRKGKKAKRAARAAAKATDEDTTPAPAKKTAPVAEETPAAAEAPADKPAAPVEETPAPAPEEAPAETPAEPATPEATPEVPAEESTSAEATEDTTK